MDNKQRIKRAYAYILSVFKTNEHHFSQKKIPSCSDEQWGKITENEYFVKKDILEIELQKIGLDFGEVKKEWDKNGYIGRRVNNGAYFHQRKIGNSYCNFVSVVKASSTEVLRLLAPEETTKVDEQQEVKETIKEQIELLHEKSLLPQVSIREIVELSKVMATLCIEYFGRI